MARLSKIRCRQVLADPGDRISQHHDPRWTSQIGKLPQIPRLQCVCGHGEGSGIPVDVTYLCRRWMAHQRLVTLVDLMILLSCLAGCTTIVTKQGATRNTSSQGGSLPRSIFSLAIKILLVNNTIQELINTRPTTFVPTRKAYANWTARD
ncbi:hypothetical protein GGR51DRAFT_330360 [Nemania sp. FL0031]|nr:hypothetical protein GGR51DRAFT_330360 [Nemania sp. FL0031]